MTIDLVTTGFAPLHLFMDAEGGYTDPDLAWACWEWAVTLSEWGYGS